VLDGLEEFSLEDYEAHRALTVPCNFGVNARSKLGVAMIALPIESRPSLRCAHLLRLQNDVVRDNLFRLDTNRASQRIGSNERCKSTTRIEQ